MNGRPDLHQFKKKNIMKHLHYIIPLLFLVAFACTQKTTEKVMEVAAAQSVYSVDALAEDTVTTSSSIDTVDFTLGTFYGPTAYEIQISADSLSGSTAATAYLEYSGKVSGSDWVSLSSTTINGVTTRARLTGDIIKGRLRLRVISANGTQSTTVRPVGHFTASQPTQ